MLGQQHLIQCHCILPQYKNLKEPIFHKFVVFSVIDDSDTVIPKFAQCNNCGVIHKIIDICKSELVIGRDESRSLISIKDIAINFPQDLTALLTSYNCELPVWENINFILRNELWGSQVIIARETIGTEISGKILTIKSNNQFIVDHYLINDTLEMKS